MIRPLCQVENDFFDGSLYIYLTIMISRSRPYFPNPIPNYLVKQTQAAASTINSADIMKDEIFRAVLQYRVRKSVIIQLPKFLSQSLVENKKKETKICF
jgi:hypothetical protein